MELDCDRISVSSHRGMGSQGREKEDEKKEHAEAKAVLGKAKIDLLTAIRTAQAKVPDGKPMRASVEEEKEKYIFEVHFLTGEKVKSVEIDCRHGRGAAGQRRRR